jgi:hypothetical protein
MPVKGSKPLFWAKEEVQEARIPVTKRTRVLNMDYKFEGR